MQGLKPCLFGGPGSSPGVGRLMSLLKTYNTYRVYFEYFNLSNIVYDGNVLHLFIVLIGILLLIKVYI